MRTLFAAAALICHLAIQPASAFAPEYNAPMDQVREALRDLAFEHDYAALHLVERGVHNGHIGGTPDKGGPTADGISKRYWGHLWDHWPPTREERLKFWRDRWDEWALYERVRDPVLRAEVYKFAAHAGWGDAVTALQCALRGLDIPVTVDISGGVWGPQMARAMARVNHANLLPGFKASVVRHYFQQSDFSAFREGWLNRIAPVPAD